MHFFGILVLFLYAVNSLKYLHGTGVLLVSPNNWSTGQPALTCTDHLFHMYILPAPPKWSRTTRKSLTPGSSSSSMTGKCF